MSRPDGETKVPSFEEFKPDLEEQATKKKGQSRNIWMNCEKMPILKQTSKMALFVV